MTNYQNNLPAEVESQPPITQSAAENWIKVIYRIAFFVVLILSGTYAISPIDAVPDVLVGPGQVDDAAVLGAGGMSIGFMTMLRIFFLAMIRRPQVRRGCMVAVVIGAVILIGMTILLFFAIAQIINSI